MTAARTLEEARDFLASRPRSDSFDLADSWLVLAENPGATADQLAAAAQRLANANARATHPCAATEYSDDLDSAPLIEDADLLEDEATREARFASESAGFAQALRRVLNAVPGAYRPLVVARSQGHRAALADLAAESDENIQTLYKRAARLKKTWRAQIEAAVAEQQLELPLGLPL